MEEVITRIYKSRLIPSILRKYEYRFDNEEEREDFTQDMYVLLLTHKDRKQMADKYYSAHKAFISWIYKIIYFQYCNKYNLKKRYNKSMKIINIPDEETIEYLASLDIPLHNRFDESDHIIPVRLCD